MTKFAVGKIVFVPMHGRGEIVEEVLSSDMECFKIKLTEGYSIIPRRKMLRVGVRFASSINEIKKALQELAKHRRVRSARNPEKLYRDIRRDITSGDIVILAQVVRDLYNKDDELTQLQSEFYGQALNRLADEIAEGLPVGRQGARGIIESLIERETLPPEWAEKLKTP